MFKSIFLRSNFLTTRIVNTFAKFERAKVHMNVGTIGHIDHGKTTLTSAITKYLASKQKAKYVEYAKIDKAPQEKARGITINTATLEYETDKRHYAHVDCPGHIDYVKNMITGAAKMDAGILVVAATDGPMPQTKQHVLLCRQIGVQNIVVFLNKMDLVKEPEVVDVIQQQLKQLLVKHQYDPNKAVFVRGSALCAIQDINPEIGEKKIQQLLNALDQKLPDPVRPVDKPFIMAIQSTYNIAGRGAVASGTIEQGKIKVGDQVQLVGYGSKIKTTVTGIETFNKTLDYGEAGDNVGILLRGLTRQQLRRGLVMAKPSTLSTHSVLEANLYCLKTEQGGRKNSFTTGYRPQLYYKTADTAAQLKLPEGIKIAMPGDNVKVQMKLNFPITISKGSRFALRQGGKTIAAGIVSEILPQQTVIDFGKIIKKKEAPLATTTTGTAQTAQTAKGGAKPQQSKSAPKTSDKSASGKGPESKSAPKPAGQKTQSKAPPTASKTQSKTPPTAPKTQSKAPPTSSTGKTPPPPPGKSVPPPKPAPGAKTPPPPPPAGKPAVKTPPPPPPSGKPAVKTPPPPPPPQKKK